MSIHTRPRSRADLESAYAEGVISRDGLRRRADPDLRDALSGDEGTLAALGWALGSMRSPLTRQAPTDIDDVVELDRERRLATDMLYGRAELDGRGQYYVSGVESTLMWVLGESDSPLF